MLQKIKEVIQNFIDAHIVGDFDATNYDPKCFDCNRGSCIEPMVCEIITENWDKKEE